MKEILRRVLVLGHERIATFPVQAIYVQPSALRALVDVAKRLSPKQVYPMPQLVP